ncbi:ABC transporter ATP-binding protein [Saccharicrinis sp. FJH62]|uniref:ABC transporter ATP-binding protein n=1 Tax=Saccharicrinis sp. FJH62 TaxID=3344657 RepID=UPI0035D4882B
MIEVKNVSKSFDGKQVLKNVSAVFEAGVTNLIIGQSGSGKTVLLKSIVGLHAIDEGRILMDGRCFSALRPGSKEKKAVRREMGMLFQGSALFDSMSVEDNVRFPLEMFTNMTVKEKQDRVDFCLDRVNIQGAHKLLPAEISGGMQKRVAIARAIALNPKYLFCDEPNSGLDPKTSIVIDQLIQEITKEYNIVTIINTHDMNSVLELGEKIIFINQGEKAWEGTSDEIMKTKDEEVRAFIFAGNTMKGFKDYYNE